MDPAADGEQERLLRTAPTFTEHSGPLLGGLFGGAAPHGGASASPFPHGAPASRPPPLPLPLPPLPPRREIVERVFGTAAAPAQRVSESLDYEPVQNAVFYKRMKAAKEQKHLFGWAGV